MNETIEKRKFIKAPADGCKCDMCKKPIAGRADVLRYSDKDANGRYSINFYGVCCAWKK